MNTQRETAGTQVPKKKQPPEAHEMQWVRAKRWSWYPPSIVEEVIRDHCDGNAAELMRQTNERIEDKKVTPQMVLGWRKRGNFPVEVVPALQAWTRLPFVRLMMKRKQYLAEMKKPPTPKKSNPSKDQ